MPPNFVSSVTDLASLMRSIPEYGTTDPNVFGQADNGRPYSEDVTWNQGGGSGIIIDPSTGTATDAAGNQVDPGYVNPNVSNMVPFNAAGGALSICILQRNLKRSMIILQNSSSVSNLWYSWGRPAIIGQSLFLVPSQVIGYDYTTPSDALYIAFDGTGTQPGFYQEISRLD